MKIIMEAIDKLYDVIDEVEYYAGKAYHLRQEHKILADAYIKSAEAHIDIFKTLHEAVVKLIAEQKEKGATVPPVMQAIWDYEHEKLVKEFAEAKYLVDEYKKAY